MSMYGSKPLSQQMSVTPTADQPNVVLAVDTEGRAHAERRIADMLTQGYSLHTLSVQPRNVEGRAVGSMDVYTMLFLRF